VKVYTDGLAHDLGNRAGWRVMAHLLIPGYPFTGMAARGTEKPLAAWRADQVVDFLLEHLAAGDFYILCPGNEDVGRASWLRLTTLALCRGDVCWLRCGGRHPGCRDLQHRRKKWFSSLKAPVSAPRVLMERL
jgi:hypothetical protein